jgi:ADP-ribosylglycohydrolase
MDFKHLSDQIISSISLPPTTPLSPSVLSSKLFGCLFGHALGDALGLRTEFRSASDSKSLWRGSEWTLKNWDLSRGFPEGDWTDDTDQMLLLLQAYLSCGALDPVQFGQSLLNWMHHGIEEFGDSCGMGIGATVFSVLSHRSFSLDPLESAVDVWSRAKCDLAANGAVMRTSVLGLIHFANLAQVIRQTMEIATVTHADPRCVASCVAMTSAIALMMQGAREADVLESSIEIAKKTIGVYTQALEEYMDENCSEKIKEGFRKNREAFGEEELERVLRGGLEAVMPLDEEGIGYTYKCIGCGFWALKMEDWMESIKTVVLEGGDADTNAAVAGALLGCKLGFNALPQNLVDELRHGDWLHEKVSQLAYHSVNSSSTHNLSIL